MQPRRAALYGHAHDLISAIATASVTMLFVNWEGDVPTGAMFHVSSFGDGSLHVADVWQSAEDFDRFVQQRLMPGVQKVGIQGEPEVKIYPVQAIFNPYPDRLK